ncbi:outer membrane beta-barrel protein [Hymenobacter sp. UYCo722]|uniref:outer membrane beta-barrel protein n=1 Tax=Hymenobacter sp. UYCo722 TaxID=3156335 RepID=UPI003392A35B
MLRVSGFFLVVSLSAAAAQAQPTFRLGVRGGLHRATTTLDAASTGTGFYDFSYSADKSALYTWQAGAVLDIAWKKFALQPALLFSQKGEQFNTTSTFGGVAGTSGTSARSTNRYHWLELPLNLVYTVRSVQLFAGPYVALGLGGRRQGTSYFTSPVAKYAPYDFNEKVRYGSDTHNPRLDAGVNFGVGYRQGPVQVQFGYGLGLRNLHRVPYDGLIAEFPYHDFDADAAYNRVAQFMATYFFEL